MKGVLVQMFQPVAYAAFWMDFDVCIFHKNPSQLWALSFGVCVNLIK